MIGKPLYLRDAPMRDGAFMVDSSPDGSTKGRIYMTFGVKGLRVMEYASMAAFTRNKTRRLLDLNGIPYFGTGHIVYKGCFYYHQAGSQHIVRYNISMEQSTTVRVVNNAIYKPDSAGQGYLYQSKNTFFDFNADSNGLWVIYGNAETKKIMVAMLSLKYLDIIKAVELDINQGSIGNAFMACGNLYTLNFFNRRQAKINSQIDLWTMKTKSLNFAFGNPFGSNRMLNYDFRKKTLMSWDASIQLSVPMLIKTT